MLPQMKAHLGVITCDKCREPMKKAQNIIVIAEGVISESEDELDFHGSCVRYACHLDCWDGVEEDEQSWNGHEEVEV